MRRIVLKLVIPLWIPLAVTFAQVVSFTNYTTRDGLVSDIVASTIQDSRGYIWAGTVEGVSVFDGFTFRNYTPSDGLPNSYINCLTEISSPPGSIAAGMNLDGYCIIQRDSVWHRTIGTTVESNRVFALLEDSRGELWCGTGAGLYVVRGDSTVPFPSDRSLGTVTSIVESPAGHLYFLSDSGLIHLDLFTGMLSSIPIVRHRGSNFHLLAKAASGGVWVGSTDSSVHRVGPGKMSTRFRLGFLPEFFLLDDNRGFLWTRSGSTLFHLPLMNISPESAIPWTSTNGLDGVYAVCATTDNEGGIWFGGGKGLVRLGDQCLLRFPLPEPPIDPYASIVADNRGNIWTLSGQSILHFLDRGNRQWTRTRSRLDHRGPQVLQLGAGNLLWIGFSDATLLGYKTSALADQPVVPSPHVRVPGTLFGPNAKLSRFMFDRDGLLWVGIVGKGLAVCDPTHPLPLRAMFAHYDSIPLYSIRALAEDHEGAVWAGEFWKGLSRYERGTRSSGLWTGLKKEDGLSDNSIRSLCVDGSGAVWAGTRYGGVTRIRGQQFSHFTVREGLASNAVWGLASNARGVWVATGGGVNLIPSERSDTVTTVEDFPRIPFKAIATMIDGRIVAFASEDLYVYDPSATRTPVTPPPVYITSFEVNGHPTEYMSSATLSHLQNNCVFEFIGLSFDRPRAVRYQYKLEGADPDWHGLTERRSVTYSALQPGSYTFMVKAVTNSGTSSLTAAKVRFAIEPPWWRIWWLRVLVSIAGIAAVAAIVGLRIRKLKREREAQEEFSRRLIDFQESERKRIGGELHDSLGQELLLLKNGIDKLSADIPQASDALGKLAEHASASLKEVRDISYDLHPHTLDRLGLRGAIESVATRFTAACNIPVQLQIDDVDGVVTKEQEINLFRVIQEGLNNIARHAGAISVGLAVQRRSTYLELVLNDDGKGFAGTKRSDGSRGGFGLTGMAERVRLIGGTFGIVSAQGRGTTVHVTIPLVMKDQAEQ